jgi:hypothetical protein
MYIIANENCVFHGVKERLNSLNKFSKWFQCVMKYNTIKKCGGAKT